MGKTKTAFISEEPTEGKSGKEAYEERRKKKEEKEKAKIRVPGLGGGQRVTAIDSGPVIEAEEQKEIEVKKDEKKPKVRSKKYQEARQKVDKNKTYSLPDAIKLIKETSYSKFDGTMELHVIVKRIGLSENISLPHSFGREKKIEIADEATVEKLKTGKIDFDVLLATADMMPKLVPFARLLGPKGLMPNPKQGTLIKTKKEAEKFSPSSMTIKTEKEQPVIHTTVGKTTQSDKDLENNIQTVLDAVNKKQIVKAYLKSTMSPSVRLTI